MIRRLSTMVMILALVLGAEWVAHRSGLSWDWTAGESNRVSGPTAQLLGSLHGPLKVTVFADDPEQVARLRSLGERLRTAKRDSRLTLVDPATAPDAMRTLGVSRAGAGAVTYGGRHAAIDPVSEQTIVDAIQQLSRERWAVFLEGHGERDPMAARADGYAGLTRTLERRGFRVQPLSLVQAGGVPDNTSVLVIAGPATDLPPAEVALIDRYLDEHGALLWLIDADLGLAGLGPVAESLGVALLDGTVIDETGYELTSDPRLVLSRSYAAEHPATVGFDQPTVFPTAGALDLAPAGDWRATALASSHARTWLETGAVEGALSFEPEAGDRQGPLSLAVALERDHGVGEQQRVVVVADTDLFSDSFVGSGANLSFGLRLFDWLAGDDAMISIEVPPEPDRRLELTPTAGRTLNLLAQLGLPLALLLVGVALWIRRRRA